MYKVLWSKDLKLRRDQSPERFSIKTGINPSRPRQDLMTWIIQKQKMCVYFYAPLVHILGPKTLNYTGINFSGAFFPKPAPDMADT